MCVGGGNGKGFGHAEGGGTISLGVVFKQSLEVLAILKRGHTKYPPLKKKGGGGCNSFTPS